MDEVRTQDKPKEAAAIKRQSFFCKRRGHKVAPAQCSDCFDAMSYTERFSYHENRQNCIKENKEKPVTPKPSPSSNLPEGHQPLPVGAEIEIKPKGQDPIHVQITQEMLADHEAALAYAAQAAHDKMRGEILLNVAVALYAGDAGGGQTFLQPELNRGSTPHTQLRGLRKWQHCPWVIDGYTEFKEAIQDVFGISQRVAYFRCAIGKALIANFGKENILAKAEEIGIAQLSHRKLRELIKAPDLFKGLCTRGYATLPSGEEITIETILEKGVAELPQLLLRFTEPPSALPTVKKKEDPFEKWDEDDPFKDTPLAKKHELIRCHLGGVRLELGRVRDMFVSFIKGWPKDAPNIIGSSPELQEEYGKLEGVLFALFAALANSTHDPKYAQEIAYNENGRMDGLGEIAKMMDQWKEEDSQGGKQEDKAVS